MFMYKSHSNVHFYIGGIIIYTMPIQAARPSPTLSYDAVSITSWSWVYPRVICCIHRLAKGYNRKLHKEIASVTCRCVNLNYFDVFPVSSIICFVCIGVLPQSKLNLMMARCSVRYADQLSLAFLKTCSCRIYYKSSRFQITCGNSVDHTDYITTEASDVLICFIKIVNIYI